MLRGQEFQKHGRVQDQVATSTKGTQAYEETEDNPIRRCSSHDGENRADQEGNVEREFAANDISRQTPKQSTDLGIR